MKMTVVIQKKQYDNLLAACEPSSDKYIWLVNGFIFRHGQGEEVHIPCHDSSAQMFMDFVAREYPKILPYIKLMADRSC
jgi:hypothetical protein